MKKLRPGTILPLLSLAAFALGLILGLTAPGFFAPISFIGTVYLNLLKLIVIPLLMAEVAVGVYRAGASAPGQLIRTVALFAVMFVISFLLTAGLVSLLRPGVGMELFGGEWDGSAAVMSPGTFFESIFPANLFAAMSAGSMLPCLLFAFVFGTAAGSVRAEKLMDAVDEFRAVCTKILSYIMWLTPPGVFSLIGSAAAGYGAALLGVCARYILTAWLGCLVVTVLVMILPVWLFCGITPIRYIRSVAPVWLLTLSTCSSAATLPTTLRVCHEEFGIPERITGVVVPLGCTIHMCGGAVSFCLLGLFTLQMAGASVTLPLFLQMLLVATLMNMAAPGIPGGGVALGAAYLGILGAPGGFIGLYSGVYRLLDMAYTSVNVTGDITANLLLAENEKRKEPTERV